MVKTTRPQELKVELSVPETSVPPKRFRQKGLLRDCQDRFAATRYADSWWWQQDGASVHTQGHTTRGKATAEAIKSVAPNQTTDWPSLGVLERKASRVSK